jgi:hypothetical protein
MALEPSVPNMEKLSFDTLRNNLNNLVKDMGSVRHPKRCVKVYARREKRELWVDSKGNIKDGRGTAYINTKDEIVAMSNDEAKMLSRFKNKWIRFAFLEDKSFYIYDKTDVKISKEDEKKQIEKFGAFGFTKVNDIDIEINKNIKEFELLNLNRYEMINCNFGYNYSQPAMPFNITIGNKRGEQKNLIHSGDLVKIYMWYDRPGDSKFQNLVEDWKENKDIDKEDEKTNKLLDYTVNFPDNRLDIIKILPKELQVLKEKMGINLMFTGIIDDTCYEYDKSSGNRISFSGRSLGSVLTGARIYKSYPLPNRLRMSHEEVIYDMVSKQTNLPIGTLALSNGDWAKGILGDPTKRIQDFDYYKNSTAGKDLKTITKEEAEQSIHDRYENEITEMFMTAGKMEEIKDVEGVVKLSENFIKAITEENNAISDKSNPPNEGENYKLSEESNIQVAELKDSGYTGPIWVYSDGKVGKDNNGGFPDGTSFKSIVEILIKQNRKQYVELLSNKWAEYGIKMPSDMKRKVDNTTETTIVKPVRLFFATGWGCVKYVLQERVVTTSSERAAKIYAIREFAQAKQSFDDIKTLTINSPDEFRVNYSPIKSSDFSLYEVPDNFDVVRFALSLNIISANEVVSGLGYNETDKNGKTYDEKVGDGDYDGEDAMRIELKGDKKNKRTKRVKEDPDTKEKKYMLIEEAIEKDEEKNPTYVDAILRIKMFYQKIRQYTRAFHDSMNQHECRSWYANTDAVKVPMETAKFKKAAINFPVCKKGEVIVIPKNLTNAPRTWKVLTKVNYDYVEQKYKTNLKDDIVSVLVPFYFKNNDGSMTKSYKQDDTLTFDSIISDESKDKIDPNHFNLYKYKYKGSSSYLDLKNVEIDSYGSTWNSIPNLWTIKINVNSSDVSIIKHENKECVILEFTVNEDEELMKELRKDNKDIAFEGDTIDEAIKKITEKHLDIVHYVDEFGLFNVRPRFAYKLAGQRREYLLETGGTFFPKYFSGRINENSSQLINQVIVMGISPGNSELMIVTINDKESIAKYGVKRDFQKISKIDDVVEAIKRAKSVLMSNRMKMREVEISCEPMFDLRPGHIIHVKDASSSLGGSFIVDTIGINYSKNGGATQSIKAFAFNNNLIDTSQLEGQVVYYSKEPGKDSLTERGTDQLNGDQISKESGIKDRVDVINKSKIG